MDKGMKKVIRTYRKQLLLCFVGSLFLGGSAVFLFKEWGVLLLVLASVGATLFISFKYKELPTEGFPHKVQNAEGLKVYIHPNSSDVLEILFPETAYREIEIFEEWIKIQWQDKYTKEIKTGFVKKLKK